MYIKACTDNANLRLTMLTTWMCSKVHVCALVTEQRHRG